MTLVDVFGTEGDLTWVQECARAVLVFAFGYLLVRLAGRRAFSRWSAVDIIVSILVGSNLSRAITGSAALWGTLLATALIMLLHWIFSHLAARYPSFARLLEGRAVVLAHQGERNAAELARHAVSEVDLREALHAAGLEDAARAHRVILEPSGKISVLKDKP